MSLTRNAGNSSFSVNTLLDDLCLIAPALLYEYILECADTPQNPLWHPEGPNERVPHNVLFHIGIVYERAREWGDVDLMMAAFFHDLGKAGTTEMNDGSWTSRGHEELSSKLVQRYRPWIEEMGCNYQKVYEVVKDHMAVKYEGQMSRKTLEKFRAGPYYHHILKFSEFDNMRTLKREE